VRGVIVQLVGLLRPDIYGETIKVLQARHDELAAEDAPSVPTEPEKGR